MIPTSLVVGDIKKRALNSFFSLLTRQVVLRAIGFISINIILAQILSPNSLGIFNIATSIITFFSFFSDVGLAASLIQKRDLITEEDIATTFTIQQLLISILVVIIIVGAPIFGHFYKLDDSGIWLIRILGIGFLLSSLKVLPSVLSERQLKFQPLVTVEIVETLIFNGLLIFLAYRGYGLWSFSVAALSRGVVGVILIYILVPVRLKIGIYKESARQLLSFGIPYQVNNFLAVIKDRLVPLVVAGMVGPAGVGYITWAQSMAFLPLEIMNIVIRISFPAFSRLQDQSAALSKAVEKSLFVTCLFVYPALFGLAALMPAIIAYVVTSKWGPSLFSFYLFGFATLWSVVSTVLTNALNAIGQVKKTLRLMIMWTVLTWIFTPVLVWQYGFNGVGLTAFLISFSSIISIAMVKRFLDLHILESVSLPLISSLLMGIAIYFYSQNFVRNRFSLITAIILGVLIYAGLIFLIGRKKVLADIRSLRHV